MTSQWPSFETMRAFSCCENPNFITLSRRQFERAKEEREEMIARIEKLERSAGLGEASRGKA